MLELVYQTGGKNAKAYFVEYYNKKYQGRFPKRIARIIENNNETSLITSKGIFNRLDKLLDESQRESIMRNQKKFFRAIRNNDPKLESIVKRLLDRYLQAFPKKSKISTPSQEQIPEPIQQSGPNMTSTGMADPIDPNFKQNDQDTPSTNVTPNTTQNNTSVVSNLSLPNSEVNSTMNNDTLSTLSNNFTAQQSPEQMSNTSLSETHYKIVKQKIILIMVLH